MIETPSYFGIIPASVRYNTKLTANAKLLYSELTALADKHGYCFATNEYFGELYGKDDKTISRWIASLKAEGYIEIEYIRRGCQVKERRIYIAGVTKTSPKGQKDHSTGDENVTPSGDEKRTDSITSISNTRNTINTLEPCGSRPLEAPAPVPVDFDEKSIHRRLRAHFEKVYTELHPQKAALYWDAKCGACTKKIITAAKYAADISGEDIDRVIGTKLSLFLENFREPDDFYAKQTYTPGFFLSQWNRLTPAVAPSNTLEQAIRDQELRVAQMNAEHEEPEDERNRRELLAILEA